LKVGFELGWVVGLVLLSVGIEIQFGDRRCVEIKAFWRLGIGSISGVWLGLCSKQAKRKGA
jgi:hypothetical protein